MCGRYVVTNAVAKTIEIVKSAIAVDDTDNYNAHPQQKLPVIKDRKSTRLNSSHKPISYAVFCLKKKKKKNNNTHTKHK